MYHGLSGVYSLARTIMSQPKFLVSAAADNTGIRATPLHLEAGIPMRPFVRSEAPE